MGPRKAYLHLLTAAAVLLTGCSSRPYPAPVEEVYQGKTYKDFEASSFNQADYQVKKGDTLFSIAWYSGNDYQDIARLNNISPPYHIFPGQILTLNGNPSQPKPDKAVAATHTKGLKIKSNQVVDRQKKQAYGEVKSKRVVNNNVTNNTNTFPGEVSRWVWPAKGKLTGRFSLSEQGNNGIDITGSRGSPIYAAAAGKVVYTGNALRGYGNLVIIKHTDAYLSAYAHNDKILVKEQQWIEAGQKIALMGSSGIQQTMLHFEVRFKGKSVDPLRYLPKSK